jgi:hypothetical protein
MRSTSLTRPPTRVMIVVYQEVWFACDTEHLPLGHAALDGHVLPKVQSARRLGRRGGTLRGHAGFAFLAPRQTLLEALALAADGVALDAFRGRRSRVRFNVDLVRLDARGRGLARVVHRTLGVHPAIDLTDRGGGDQQKENRSNASHEYCRFYSRFGITYARNLRVSGPQEELTGF